jgi:hypothetical protein
VAEMRRCVCCRSRREPMLIQNVRAHVVAAVASSIVASSAFAGPEWVENGDAGSILSFAQKTFGADQIASIAGTLSFDNGIAGANDLEDMYLIQVINPALPTLMRSSLSSM